MKAGVSGKKEDSLYRKPHDIFEFAGKRKILIYSLLIINSKLNKPKAKTTVRQGIK